MESVFTNSRARIYPGALSIQIPVNTTTTTNGVAMAILAEIGDGRAKSEVSRRETIGKREHQPEITGLFEAFGRPVPPSSELDIYINNTGTGLASSRHLHEHLGFKYDCVDIDGNFGSLTLDLNFDSVPPDRRGKYGLTTNHGTSEHILDQRNTFKAIHDFTAPGGLMLHALPFTVHLEHGFFNYQPNLFDALARYNPTRRSEPGWDRTGRFRASFHGSPGCWSF